MFPSKAVRLRLGAGGASLSAKDISTMTATSTADAFDVTGLHDDLVVHSPFDISVAAARNQTNKNTEVSIRGSAVEVAGDLQLESLRSNTVVAVAKATAISDSLTGVSPNRTLSLGGTYSSNVMIGDVNAFITGSTISTTGSDSDVRLKADDTSVIYAKSESSRVLRPHVPKHWVLRDGRGCLNCVQHDRLGTEQRVVPES